MNADTKIINPSRRNFLRVGAAGAGALALGALNQGVAPLGSKVAKAAGPANVKRLVILNMIGGCDGLNLLVPVTGSVASIYLSRRPVLGIQQGQGLALTGGPAVSEFELNPSFANLQSMWNQNEVAFVNKVGYPNKNLSHFVSEDVWSYGARDGMASLGGLAPGWVARYGNAHAAGAMGLVSIGVGRRLDFEGSTSNPFLVSSVSSFKYDRDYHYSNNDTLRKQVVQNILSMQTGTGTDAQIASAAEAAYNASAQVDAASQDYEVFAGAPNNIQYPQRAGSTSLTTIGSRLRDIALLIYGGFDTRIFYTGIGGFDTHSDQLARQTDLFKQIDDALGVFRQDLMLQGAWNDTVVLIISEFGRRNYENGSDGTDHGVANIVTALGGPIQGGIYGNALVDADLNAEYLPYETDFRDVYRNLLGTKHMGLTSGEIDTIFPETQPLTNPVDML